eukprot:jgi/Undpi1/6951/HiC_scaffold_21.g09425.m1
MSAFDPHGPSPAGEAHHNHHSVPGAPDRLSGSRAQLRSRVRAVRNREIEDRNRASSTGASPYYRRSLSQEEEEDGDGDSGGGSGGGVADGGNAEFAGHGAPAAPRQPSSRSPRRLKVPPNTSAGLKRRSRGKTAAAAAAAAAAASGDNGGGGGSAPGHDRSFSPGRNQRHNSTGRLSSDDQDAPPPPPPAVPSPQASSSAVSASVAGPDRLASTSPPLPQADGDIPLRLPPPSSRSRRISHEGRAAGPGGGGGGSSDDSATGTGAAPATSAPASPPSRSGNSAGPAAGAAGGAAQHPQAPLKTPSGNSSLSQSSGGTFSSTGAADDTPTSPDRPRRDPLALGGAIHASPISRAAAAAARGGGTLMSSNLEGSQDRNNSGGGGQGSGGGGGGGGGGSGARTPVELITQTRSTAPGMRGRREHGGGPEPLRREHGGGKGERRSRGGGSGHSRRRGRGPKGLPRGRAMGRAGRRGRRSVSMPQSYRGPGAFGLAPVVEGDAEEEGEGGEDEEEEEEEEEEGGARRGAEPGKGNIFKVVNKDTGEVVGDIRDPQAKDAHYDVLPQGFKSGEAWHPELQAAQLCREVLMGSQKLGLEHAASAAASPLDLAGTELSMGDRANAERKTSHKTGGHHRFMPNIRWVLKGRDHKDEYSGAYHGAGHGGGGERGERGGAGSGGSRERAGSGGAATVSAQPSGRGGAAKEQRPRAPSETLTAESAIAAAATIGWPKAVKVSDSTASGDRRLNGTPSSKAYVLLGLEPSAYSGGSVVAAGTGAAAATKKIGTTTTVAPAIKTGATAKPLAVVPSAGGAAGESASPAGGGGSSPPASGPTGHASGGGGGGGAAAGESGASPPPSAPGAPRTSPGSGERGPTRQEMAAAQGAKRREALKSGRSLMENAFLKGVAVGGAGGGGGGLMAAAAAAAAGGGAAGAADGGKKPPPLRLTSAGGDDAAGGGVGSCTRVGGREPPSG